MTSSQREKTLSESVGIIGAGPAGLINAHVLLQDGFTNIRVITRDKSVGGVWAKERVYPGLCINNVHGEYRFSAMEMPPPSEASITGGRLSGQDLSNYMQKYYEKFLKERVQFQFNTEVLNISRGEDGTWLVRTENTHTHASETLEFCRIILATGGCSEPNIPDYLSPAAAEKYKFDGVVIHSSQFAAQRDTIIKTQSEDDEGSVVVIGGGKSAQDVCVRLTLDGLKCCNVFDTTDSFLAATTPLPTFIRRSRFLSLLSPHIHLRTRLERFLHDTNLGSKLTHFLWNKIQGSSFDAFPIPNDSPLRRTHSLFWGIRTNDVGTARPESYHNLAATNQIEVIAPARAIGFSPDGCSVLLDNGKSIIASAVVLATGYRSSWTKIFSDETAEELGISKHAPTRTSDVTHMWDYTSLHGAPKPHPENQKWVTSIHRGIIPAKNILRRDFAIAGALFTANIGYTSEICAHWISSYFLNEDMRLPNSVEEAITEAELASTWMKTRYPEMHSWVNASYSGSLDFWTWPQAADDLLEDMKLPVHRSGGSWLTWPFKVIELNEIASIGEERRVKRRSAATTG